LKPLVITTSFLEFTRGITDDKCDDNHEIEKVLYAAGTHTNGGRDD